MAETLNTNVFPVTVNGEPRGAKFVDFAGLDYFWSKVKGYVDGVDTTLSQGVATNSANIATNSSAITKLQEDLNSLSGGAGSVAEQIDNKIAALNLPTTYETIEHVSSHVAVLTEAIATAKAGAEATAAEALKGHTDNGDIHVTKDQKDAWTAATTAINTFLKDADMSQNAVDTLAELQAYMTADGSAATELVNTVAANTSAIAANTSAIGSVVTKMGEDIAKAKEDAAADATSKANTAKSEAIAAAAEDATSKADTAKSEAIAAAAADATSKANTAKSEAIAAAAEDATSKAEAAKEAAISQAQKDAQEYLKSYYTKSEIDTKVTEILATAQGYATTAENNAKSYTDTAESNAKAYAATYTNELFESFQFVTDSDIDGMFSSEA